MSLESSTLTLFVEDLEDAGLETSPPVLLADEVVAERFRIVRGLGHGGMGQVYEAFDTELDQSVALKVIRPELALLPAVVEHFKNEVRLGRRITHPNVCRIFDLYQHRTPGRPHGGLVFLTMELIRGRTLTDVLRQAGFLRPAESELVLRQVAAALSAAHQAGVVHGDLKPGNVLLSGDGESTRVVVTDFGLALAAMPEDASPDGIAATFHGMGTPAYKAPEQRAGAGASRQSDVYAFGLVAYETLTGRRFSAQAPPLSELVPSLPPELETLVLRCLDPEPRRRPSSARLFLDEPAILDGRPRPGQVPPHRPHGLRRRRVLAGVLGIALVVAGTMGGLVRRISEEATLALNAARFAVAVDWMDDDPTIAALALLEVERPGPRVRALMRQALTHPLARLEHRFPDANMPIAVSPGGKLVAVSSLEGPVYLWSTGLGGDTTNDPRVLHGHQGYVPWVEFDPDGRRLLTIGYDLTVRIWDLEGDTPPIVLRGHTDKVWQGEFDPDGRHVVTRSNDHTARVWPIDGKSEPVVLRGHSCWLMDARFSPDGKRIVTASCDDTVRVWNADGSGEPTVFEGHTDWVYQAAFSPDGRHVVSASRDGTARIWDTRGIEDPIVLRGHEGPVDRASFRPDGQQVLTSSQDGSVRVWSLDGDEKRIVVRGTAATAADYMPGSDSILVRSNTGLSLVPNSGRGAPVAYHRSGPDRHAFSADGRWLAVLSGKSVRLWDVEAEPWGRTIVRNPSEVRALAPSPDGRWIATGGNDFVVRLWSRDGDKTIDLGGHKGSVYSVAFRPGGGQLVSGSRDDTARLWSLDPPGESVTLIHEASVFTVAYHPGGEVVATGSFDGTVRFWHADPPGEAVPDRHIATVPVSSLAIGHVAFSPDGRLVLAADTEGVLRILSLGTDVDQTLSPAVAFVFDQSPLRCPQFDPAGRLATVAEQGVVKIWELSQSGSPSPRLVREIELRDPGIDCARFDTTGRRLITTSESGVVRIVDLEGDGEPIELLGHDGPVTSAFFLPDGHAVTGSVDRTLRLWDVERRNPREALLRATQICLAPELRQNLFLESEDESRRRHERCRRGRNLR